MSTASQDKLLLAHAAESEGDVVRAARLYEAAYAEGQLSPRELANLICLYWQMTDFGFSSAKQLSPEVIGVAGDRLDALLREAETKIPDDPELRFWVRYIRWLDTGRPYLLEDAEAALTEDPSCRLPLVFIAQQPAAAAQYLGAIEQLRNDYANPHTHRERYIYSTLTSALERLRKLREKNRVSRQ